MARVNAQQWLQKWGTNLNAAGSYVKDGVNRVQTAPGASAAAAADRMLAGVTASVQNGTWAKRVGAVSLQQWQQAMINKGLPRIAQGVSTAQSTKQGQITALLSAVDTATAAANALPKGGLEQGIARATAYMRAMSAAAPKRTGAGQ
ncbi:MAG: hypothetical protein RB191_24950 [Terriglobia bacterium]|nr:hypothetical protein [Terriglobia bacterium]